MKKSLVAALVAVVLVGVVGATGAVFAQSTSPDGLVPGQGYGNRAQVQVQDADGLGIYHDELMTSFSEALNISVEDLQTRIDAGETLAEIALSEGMTFEEIKALMPMGGYGLTGAAGRGVRFAKNNGEFTPGYFGDGVCLEDGEVAPHYLGPQSGADLSRGGRW